MALPRNRAGLTALETLVAVRKRGIKFSKSDAAYVEPSPSYRIVCAGCRFFLRDPNFSIGKCQVVSGKIKWNGTSGLFINALDEAREVYKGTSGTS